MLAAVLVSSFLSPVLIQGWHVLIALPVACLSVAAWITYRWRTAGSSLRAILALFVLWHIPASLLLFGHPMYAKPASPELPRHIAPEDLQILIPGTQAGRTQTFDFTLASVGRQARPATGPARKILLI